MSQFFGQKFINLFQKMELKENNIHPLLDRILQRPDKEKLLNQKAKVIWFTGLSGSGKSTLGLATEKILHQKGFLTQVLDGDNIRVGLNRNLKFTAKDRMENIRRIAEVSKLFLNCGVITINCFISPTEEIRELSKEIIGEKDFIEIFINAPLEVCEKRDVKGLYKKARRGEIQNFTGITAPFEIPLSADLEIETHNMSIEESARKILDFILPRVSYNKK